MSSEKPIQCGAILTGHTYPWPSYRLEIPTFPERVADMASRVTYKAGYRLICSQDKKDPQGRFYYQVECDRPDIYTGEPGTGRGGKAYLSEFMTDSELSRVIFGLFRAYEEHECREWFQVDGVSVFGPHISLEALLVAGKNLEFREPQ